MLWITTYRTKPFMTKTEIKELMAVFAEVGPGPGTTAHYVAADGSHGVVVSDTDDIGATYRNMLHYAEWIQFDTSPMLSVDDAVPHVIDALA